MSLKKKVTLTLEVFEEHGKVIEYLIYLEDHAMQVAYDYGIIVKSSATRIETCQTDKQELPNTEL